MQDAGYSIIQIFSRSIHNAQHLAEKLHCSSTTDIKEITTGANLYIFSIKDDALSDILAAMPQTINGLWIHTAGSLPMDIFSRYTDSYGVIYPLQTISKQRETNFSKIPLFIEGNTPEVESAIYDIAVKLSGSVTVMNSEKRKYLHLAAVFACNFSNHLYTIASQLLEKQGIDWRLLQPLIDETANKLHTMHPEQAQTGPAIRFDRSIMEQHEALLTDDRIRNLYRIISKSIYSQYINKEQL
jgi:predicted short-subunit dehydrogenase-like oxidoreductase (DUF2520 family)